MRIEELHIKGFGKFCDFISEFGPGFNIVFGDNESGKSTLQAFIKGMLYSLKGGRPQKDGILPPLRRFKPWHSNEYKGRIKYRLDRDAVFIVKRDFDDLSVKVFDAFFNDISDTFNQSKESGPQFAISHLGLNESCFEKTAFIGQLNSRIDASGSREIIERLSNLSQTGAEDVCLKRAQQALKEALVSYVGTDKTSTRPLDNINLKLKDLDIKRKELIRERESLIFAEEKLKSLTHAKNLAKEENSLLTLGEDILEVRSNIEGLKKQTKELGEILKQVCALEEEKGTLSKKIDELFEDSIKAAHSKYRLVKTVAVGFLIICAALMILQTFIPFVVTVGVVLGLLGLGLLGLDVYLYRGLKDLKIKRHEYDMKVECIDNDINSAKVNMVEIIHFSDKIDQANKYLQSLYDRSSVICEFDINSKDDIVKALQQINHSVESLYNDIDVYAYKIRSACRANNFSDIEFDEFMQKLLDTDIKEARNFIDEKMKEVNVTLNDINIEIGQKEAFLSIAMDIDDEVLMVDKEIEDCELERQRLIDTGFCIRTAIDVLEEANLEINRSFIPSLNSKISDFMNEITSQKYSELKADDDFCIKAVEPYGDIVALHLLSGGTIDQAYLAMRLALVEVMEEGGESLPLIMDEIFAQYDDYRMSKTLELLREISNRRQIILFTCKKRELDAAIRVFGNNINIIRI